MILHILSFLLLGNGSYISTTNFNSKNIDLPKNKYHFQGSITYDATKDEYLLLVNKIKMLEIFCYKINDIDIKTTIHRNNNKEFVKIDDEIAVTTASLADWLFTTSFEKVCHLEENENSFSICLMSEKQNIINGYYRINVKFINNKIELKYTKVQSSSTLLFKLIDVFFNEKYINKNIESVKNTINFLSQKDTFTINDVIFEIK